MSALSLSLSLLWHALEGRIDRLLLYVANSKSCSLKIRTAERQKTGDIAISFATAVLHTEKINTTYSLYTKLCGIAYKETVGWVFDWVLQLLNQSALMMK